jgi:regulator of protease activity HflC (stomatin/prohibitin superfamily)
MLRRIWRYIRNYVHEHAPEVSVFIFVVAFVIIFFSSNIFYSIPAGRVGVLWKRFGGGTILDHTLAEGIHSIFPWDQIYIYDARMQLLSHDFDVLSADGLKIVVNIAYRFELNGPEIPTLAKYIGPDYQGILLEADIGARARDVFAKNTPVEIFSERREEAEKKITDEVQHDIDHNFNPPWRTGKVVRFVKIWDVLIRSITLPPSVAAAIERKNEQLQLNEEYDYRLLREAKEAERKRIEAHGIKEFQDTITPTITDAYLRWQGIQATLELARSPNTKIVIIGSGKDGLPVILNPDGPTPGTQAAPTGTAAAGPVPPPRSPPPAAAPPAAALPPSGTPPPAAASGVGTGR